MPHPLFEKHGELLAQAVAASEARAYWCPYDERPEAYGADALERGQAAFEACRDAAFYLDQPGVTGRGGAESSPYGLRLDISYPRCAVDSLIAAAKSAMPAWVKAGADARAGVCAEILARLNAGSAELAYATMHTTGQPLSMAFRSAGPLAQARGLEAVAAAWREMKRIPERVLWQKPRGPNAAVNIDKRFQIVPRGIALVASNAGSPAWNAYPPLFASLAAGNPVIVKPHPAAVLPMAISVAVARQTLKEAGFDANLASLLIEDFEGAELREAALKPDIRLIDYAGSQELCDWLEANARQALLHLEPPGLNCLVFDSAADYSAALANVAFSLSLYSGQMRSTPRLLFVPASGIGTPQGEVSAEQFGRDLTAAINKLLDTPVHAAEILGALISPAHAAGLDFGDSLGEVVRESDAVRHPLFPDARIRGPLLVKVLADEEAVYAEPRPGPITFIVEAATTPMALALAERIMREKGALTFSLYSESPQIQALGEEVAQRLGVSFALNLTGSVHVNQTMAFSDVWCNGASPVARTRLAGNVAGNRFLVIESRRED